MKAQRSSRAWRLAVVGLGFMGQTHLQAIARARRSGLNCRLTAVCDRQPERFEAQGGDRGNISTTSEGPLFDTNEVFTTTDYEQLLARDDVDAVVLCTPTDSHVPLAIRALGERKHVLLEKPVATTAAAVEQLLHAQPADRVCMPAMCMRFWPGWDLLQEQIESGIEGRGLGPLRSLHLRRVGARPDWGLDFYGDDERCGGALVDLHIHDTDFVRWCLGMPSKVSTVGSAQHLTTSFRYAHDAELQVVVEGGWIAAPEFPFRMSYSAHFEKGSMEFDSTRKKPLVTYGMQPTPPLATTSGYDGELDHFIRVLDGEVAQRATLVEAHQVMQILEAERRSLREQQEIVIKVN